MEKLSAESFEQNVSQQQGRVIVKFYADWCPDCRRIESGAEQISKDFAGRFRFYAVDTEAEPLLAERFNVRGIPSFLVFDKGAETTRLYSRDAKTVEQVEKFIRELAQADC